MKEIPISKIYEAISAVSDGRIEKKEENIYQVISSDHSKAYTVVLKENLATSNDNATYWQHYAGYPIIAVLLYEKEIEMNPELLQDFKSVPWKTMNQKNKNDYEKSIQEFLLPFQEEEREKIRKENEKIEEEVMKLNLEIKGNRKPLVILS